MGELVTQATPYIVGAAVFIALFLSSYLKAPKDEVYIITGGIRKKAKILLGRAGIRFPLIQRMDRLKVGLIQVDVKVNNVPTNDFIEVSVDSVANVRVSLESIETAARNFLNKSDREIASIVQQTLEGNIREIIGQMEVRSIVTDKQEFSNRVQTNAADDMKNIGLEIMTFNIQDVRDGKDVISNLGEDNLSKIRKDATIAKSGADRDIEIAEAANRQEANIKRVEAEKMIAEQNRDLAIAEAKALEESSKAESVANLAGEIATQEEQAKLNRSTIEAEIEKSNQTILLREKDAIVKERELEASVRKEAEANKFKIETEAEAAKTKKIKEAEAEKEAAIREAEAKKEVQLRKAEADSQSAEMNAKAIRVQAEAEAAAIKMKAEAEAAGIEAKGSAEAKALEKKAEAMNKMEAAAVLEMMFKVMPDIAHEVSAPLGNVDSIVMYGGDNTTKLVESGIKNLTQVNGILEEATGINLKDIISKFAGKAKQALGGEQSVGGGVSNETLNKIVNAVVGDEAKEIVEEVMGEE
jgi:flotillin